MNIDNFKIGNLDCYRDWDNDGAIYMRNAQTTTRYCGIIRERFHFVEHGLFFAFNKEDFDKQYKQMLESGIIKKEDKIYYDNYGLFGIVNGFEACGRFIDDKNARIAKECDPQEVYFYEWNNHECMYADDSDAFAVVCKLFGNERANEIKRIRKPL